MTQQSTDVALERCPFCGGDGRSVKNHDPYLDKHYTLFIRCDRCKAEGEKKFAHCDDVGGVFQQVSDLWNTRATLSKPVGEVMTPKQMAAHIDMDLGFGLDEEMEAAFAEHLSRWQSQLAQPPEGYVLVPLEPTEAMLQAGVMAHLYKTSTLWFGGQGKSIYKAMIAAAPKGGKDV